VIGWDEQKVCPKCGHNMDDVTDQVTIVENDDGE